MSSATGVTSAFRQKEAFDFEFDLGRDAATVQAPRISDLGELCAALPLAIGSIVRRYLLDLCMVKKIERSAQGDAEQALVGYCKDFTAQDLTVRNDTMEENLNKYQAARSRTLWFSWERGCTLTNICSLPHREFLVALRRPTSQGVDYSLGLYSCFRTPIWLSQMVNEVEHLSASSDGDHFLSTEKDPHGYVTLWSSTGEQTCRVKTGKVVDGIGFDPDGKSFWTLLGPRMDSGVAVREVVTYDLMGKKKENATFRLEDVDQFCPLPDGRFAISAHNCFIVLDRQGKRIHTEENRPVKSIALSPEGGFAICLQEPNQGFDGLDLSTQDSSAFKPIWTYRLRDTTNPRMTFACGRLFRIEAYKGVFLVSVGTTNSGWQGLYDEERSHIAALAPETCFMGPVADGTGFYLQNGPATVLLCYFA